MKQRYDNLEFNLSKPTKLKQEKRKLVNNDNDGENDEEAGNEVRSIELKLIII